MRALRNQRISYKTISIAVFDLPQGFSGFRPQHSKPMELPMRTSSILTLLLVGAMSMTMGACKKNKNDDNAASQSRGSSSRVGQSELLLVNNSAEPIFHVHMSPSAESTWGDDLLGSSVLHVGDQFRISGIAAGLWDIRVVDSSGNKKEFYRQEVGASGSYTLNIDSYGWSR